MLGWSAHTLVSRSTRPSLRIGRGFGARVRRGVPQAPAGEPDFALVLYHWQRPRSFVERTFFLTSGGQAKTYYLRAVTCEGAGRDRVEVGTDAENQELFMPKPVRDETYTGSKVVPGVIARYRLPGHGEGGMVGVDTDFSGAVKFRSVYLETEFKGVVLGWDEQDYWVWPLPGPDLQMYDTARRAVDLYDTSVSVRVPRAYFIDAGMPEVETFSALPFGVYAALAVPVSFSRIQVLVDGVEVDVEQQKDVLPACLLSELEGDSEVPPSMAENGLVLSRVGLQVDGMHVPIYVPLCQLC